METVDHFVRMLWMDKHSKMIWHFIVVYVLTKAEGKEYFMVEVANLCGRCKGGVVIGGDFNIIMKTIEKNKPCVLSKWSRMFNSIINLNGLQ
jgi:hypothetical protein